MTERVRGVRGVREVKECGSVVSRALHSFPNIYTVFSSMALRFRCQNHGVSETIRETNHETTKRDTGRGKK